MRRKEIEGLLTEKQQLLDMMDQQIKDYKQELESYENS